MNDSWERLYGRRTFGVKLGLHVTEAMLASLDNPQLSCPVVHVAGTNGKGSVCALVASILAAAGCKVGLYTSPHLVRFNERFRIDGQDIPDDELDELVEKIEGVADEVSETLGQEANQKQMQNQKEGRIPNMSCTLAPIFWSAVAAKCSKW